MLMRPCTPVEAVGLGLARPGTSSNKPDISSGLLSGRENANQLSGPIGIAEASGQMAQQIPTLGVWPLVNLIALLSVSIGLLNLMPVPLLDGGHLLFFAIEAFRGRALNERCRNTPSESGLPWCVR